MLATFLMALTTTVCSQTADVRDIPCEVSSPRANSTQLNSNNLTLSPPPDGCVLLKNDHVLFGQARQIGEYVIVLSRQGGEIRLPREQVACWAPSIRNLYQFRVDHQQPGDLNTHLADASWCLRYDLFDLAATELRAAYAIDATSPEARRIEQRLERRISQEHNRITQEHNRITQEHTRPKENHSTTGPPQVAQLQFESPVIEHASNPIEGRPLQLFASQIQPMLINRCSNCHSHRLAGQTKVQWRIFAPPSGTRASAEFTRSNLGATLPYLDNDNPADSPLLKYATTKHGGEEAPLGLRNAKAINGLQRWVEMAAIALNTATASPASANKTTTNNEAIFSPVAAPQSVSAPQSMDSGLTSVSTMWENEGNTPDQLEPQDVLSSGPSRLPIVENPFDPDLFNRRFHMKTDGRP
ncbi:MAG: hypothetical protein VYA84_13950 [Planctomycetota bacterium]|nr:hypothetical protein [Planctomycetota bacterium]